MTLRVGFEFLTVACLTFRSIERVEDKYDQHPMWSMEKRKMYGVLLKGIGA